MVRTQLARVHDRCGAPTSVVLPAIAGDRSFADDVILGLSSVDKHLPCKYFYDELGSRLFDRLTELPEYYPTRTELALMQAHAVAIAHALGPDVLLVELGSGSSRKTPLLLDALDHPVGYVPVDISTGHLLASATALAAEFPALEVLPIPADFTLGFEFAWAGRQPQRVVVYFPGSTIGNFPAADARRLLAAIEVSLRPRDGRRPGALVLGFDRVKSAAVLERAYDDAERVTAAFNLNLLARINRELDGDFVLDDFAHRAVWMPEHARIEMHLVCRQDLVAHAAGLAFAFRRGESILTEYSHKYTELRILELTRAAGLRRARLWDADGLFGVGVFEA